MSLSTRLALLLLVAAPLAWAAPPAAKPDLKAAERACKPGTDPHEPGKEDHPGGFFRGGKTPSKLPGVVTVSVREAKCLMDKLGPHLVVVQAMTDRKEQLPRAQVLEDGGSSQADERAQLRVAEQLAQFTDGDRDRPLLVYCHHSSCQLSYNASLRAVQAGYRKIYWMRDGNQGWASAHYPFKGDEVDAQGLSGHYHEAIRACEPRYSAARYAQQLLESAGDDARLQALYATGLQQGREARVRCLEQVTVRFVSVPAAVADVARRVARNDQAVAQAHQAARDAVEANPAAAFSGWLDRIDAGKLATTLARARGLRSLGQICGSLDTSVPNSQSQLDDAHRRLSAYQGCLERVESDRSDEIETGDFASATQLAAATARYTCSRSKQANCLPDGAWRDVATPANHQLVLDAVKRRQQRQGPELDAAVQNMNAWVDRVNQRVEESNRRPVQTYTPPTYTPPTYDGGRYGNGRRDSSTSAPGIR